MISIYLTHTPHIAEMHHLTNLSAIIYTQNKKRLKEIKLSDVTYENEIDYYAPIINAYNQPEDNFDEVTYSALQINKILRELKENENDPLMQNVSKNTIILTLSLFLGKDLTTSYQDAWNLSQTEKNVLQKALNA